jgi:hypothetical protein
MGGLIVTGAFIDPRIGLWVIAYGTPGGRL